MNCLIDLHLHIDGSISPASAKRLAAMQNIDLGAENDAALKQKLVCPPECRSLNDYLTRFELPLSLLQTPEALSDAVQTLCEELEQQGLIYAELRYAPQLHCQNGMTQKDAVSAAVSGLKRSGFNAKLILCCMRGDANLEQNKQTVNVAAEFLGNGIAAVDLAGAEALYPTFGFAELFRLARELGVPYTIHAGEADGAQSVWSALEFGTMRVGHGVRSAEDDALLQTLAEKGATLELCPTSNLHTRIFNRIEDYPLQKLMQSGVKVTINTDNMTVSDTTLQKEYALLRSAFDLSDKQLKAFLNNAVNASFNEPREKALLNKYIEDKFKA